MSEISLNHQDFKALSSESRANILKILEGRNYTLSELAAKTKMAAPTVKQHTSILVESGLIELRDEGRKWKYYALTHRGREVLGAQRPQQQTNILLVLSGTAIIALLGIALLFSNLGLYSPIGTSSGIGGAQSASISANDIVSEKNLATPQSATGAAQARCTPTFSVDYSPAQNGGISASEEYAQKCYINTTEQDCAQVDVYDEQTHIFGQEDGKPDCIWFESPQNP